MRDERVEKIDLHGYHPNDIVGDQLTKFIQQAWEAGKEGIQFIHGHGHARGISPGFVNTNTGYFGLSIRRQLRSDENLRRWIMHTTLDRSDPGSTSVKLKPNPAPTRDKIDDDAMPPSSIPHRRR
jgi:hypothetical protein